MPATLDWKTIAWRLLFTVIAGIVIGFNRGERGRPAGMCTTVLVCLAASLSMILANLLLSTAGKAQDSFSTIDPMRLPLGILSGMGFIGAGTILRKGNLVLGVTTAATLWFVTVMGLCFGQGAIGLGLAALALGCVILWGLKYVEGFMRQDLRGTVAMTVLSDGLSDAALRERIAREKCRIALWSVAYQHSPSRREIVCEIVWRPLPTDTRPPLFVESLANEPSISALAWRPQGNRADTAMQHDDFNVKSEVG